MKILAFVDVHANKLAMRELGRKAQDADLLLCAGDISVFGNSLKESIDIMDSWNKPCLVIHGNHEDEDETRELCERSKHLTFIHGKELTIGGTTITGWGGGGFSRRDTAFERFAAALTPKSSRILMTHAPPYETAIDFQPFLGAHVGCHSYMDAIARLEPALALAGHIHERFGDHEQRGKTIILNPGPLGVMIELQPKSEAAKPKAKAKAKTKKKPQ
jgi:Icc-related predicted phosphoesterase